MARGKCLRRVAVGVLGALLVAAPAMAMNLQQSIKQQAALAARTGALPRGQNPYMIPGVALAGGGALLAIFGMVHDTGGQCSVTGVFSVTASCSATHSKAVIFTGVGAAAAGVYLLLKGRAEEGPVRNLELVPQPRGLAIRDRVSW